MGRDYLLLWLGGEYRELRRFRMTYIDHIKSIPSGDLSADHLRLTIQTSQPALDVATEILRFSFAENEDDQQVVFQIDQQNDERRPSKLPRAALPTFVI
jgi:hypothetical protein